MENIALIAVVVLVIILALIVMLMRRNQADADVFEDEPILPSDAEHADSNIINQSTSITDTIDERVQPPQFGLIAKQLMAQQRYDEAEAELIRGIHSQPNNNQLKLDLLGLYAQTSKVNKFHTTYAQIQQSGDTNIISEAHHLKSLIDAEMQTQHRPQPSAQPVQSTHSSDDMNLDFGTDGLNDVALGFDDQHDQQPTQPQPDDAFSLEDLEADLLGSTPVSNNTTAGLDNNSDGLTFDLDSEPTVTPKSTSNQPPAKADADEGLDFDFGIKEELTDSPSNDTLNTSDELSFDLSGENAVSDSLSLDDTTPMSSPASVEPAVTDTDFHTDTDSDLGLDFDFSLDSEPASTSSPTQSTDLSSSSTTSTSTTAPTTDDDFGLDFDLDTQADTGADYSNQQANTQVNESRDKEDLLSEDTLDFDLSTDAVEAATDSTAAQVNDDALLDSEFDFGDFGLDDDLTSADQKPKPQPQTQKQEQTQPSQQDIAELQDFDLGLDLDNTDLDFTDTADASPAQSDPKTKELSISDLTADLQGFDNELTFDSSVEASSDTQPSNTKVEEAGVDDGLQADFDLGEFASDAPAQTKSDDSGIRQDLSTPTEPASKQVDDNATMAFDDTYAQLDALGDDLYAFDDQTNNSINTVSDETKADDTAPIRQTTSSFEHLDSSNVTQPANRSDLADLADLADFDVSELDNAQITLNLAEQYIELGEYDSARRLLNEVTQSANEQYAPQAKALLTQIN